MPDNTHKTASPAKGNLGTFAGVFTPSILTILGIILFRRLGYVVGSAGLGRALLIIILANGISVMTTFSLSAIATNLKVKSGGDYYIISRTLGMEFGGAIGIVLFLAQSVSIGFYCIGFSEAVSVLLPWSAKSLPQIVATLAMFFLFICAWMGADWATRFQYVVMSLIGIALFSFLLGGLINWDTTTVIRNWQSPSAGPGFWVLFAIFFPAVTGFTQGVSMSGDLKDAGKSLPLGTFLAVGISILVYFGAAIVFAAALPAGNLAADYDSMKRVAVIPFLIPAGVIAATLSSAMASFLGAPRILQALAGDGIFPFLSPFAKGSGPAANPRRGVLLSAGIGLATIALGNLNVIAPVVSMFFLISYGLLNYATFYEARAASPSFRPTFKWFDSRLSLLGSLGCLGAMLAINLPAGAVAIAILFAIHQYLRRTARPAGWADSRRSHYLRQLRENLIAAAMEPEHPRDWRPQIIAFSSDSPRRGQLLRFASWLEGGSGITSVAKILVGDGQKVLKQKKEAEEELRRDIEAHGAYAFPLVVVAPEVHTGVQILVQGYGIGPLKANTILLNWLDKLPADILGLVKARYGQNLRAAFRLGSNLVILDADEDEWASLEKLPPKERSIDVWWWNDATSRLMLLFAYLMTRHVSWNEATIRVLAEEGEEKSEHGALDHLLKTLQDVRIEAEPIIIQNISDEKIIEYSSRASLVFLPFRLKRNQVMSRTEGKIDDLVAKLPVVAMVLAAKDIDLHAEPEEGAAGEIAAAIEALHAAEKKAQEKGKEAEQAEKEAEEKLLEVKSALASGLQEDIESKIRAASEAKAHALDLARRAAKAWAKAEKASRTAEKIGAPLEKKRTDSQSSSQARNPNEASIIKP